MHDHLRLDDEEREHLSQAVERFPRCRILIIGDLMLDTFIWGDVTRISPEAPVPVVEVREETRLLGGTANVVHNAASLGAQVTVTGVIGNDHPGSELIGLLEGIRVPTDGLIVEEGRPTTIKTRIIAQNQQVVRYDRERRAPLGGDSLDRMLTYIRERLDGLDGIIVSDYAKGVVTMELMDALRSMRASKRLPVIVDPKLPDAALYRGVSLVTPNHLEAARMSGIEIHDTASLVAAGTKLLERLECETVLITRGKAGMSLFQRDGAMTNIPTVARRVYDVTGAGDTVIATLTLGIAAGLPPVKAALLANIAAGIVVGEVGTAAVSASQLLDAVGSF
ncbi:MAG: D-glycero-beta-D-manno-heptose-7-phosphate kinase [Syntrophobacteraceae bacterium]